MDTPIKTRFFIISDTHGEDLASRLTEPVDVVIHCGDLTEHSKLDEFGQAIRLLKSIDAPLKLVIAGNHDWTLDDTLYEEKLVESKFKPPKEDQAVRKAFGDFGEARALFEAERSAGIVFLDEGTHDFQLANGSSLRVYASPFTPSHLQTKTAGAIHTILFRAMIGISEVMSTLRLPTVLSKECWIIELDAGCCSLPLQEHGH